MKTYLYSECKQQNDLLAQLLKEGDGAGDDEIINTAVDDIAGALQQQFSAKNKNAGNKFVALTPEQRAIRERAKAKEKNRNSLFKAWHKTDK